MNVLKPCIEYLCPRGWHYNSPVSIPCPTFRKLPEPLSLSKDCGDRVRQLQTMRREWPLIRVSKPSSRTDQTETGDAKVGDSKLAAGVAPRGPRRAQRRDTIRNHHPTNGETLSSAVYDSMERKHTMPTLLPRLRSVRPDARRPLENPPTLASCALAFPTDATRKWISSHPSPGGGENAPCVT